MIICPACNHGRLVRSIACWHCVTCGHVTHDLGASVRACWRQYVLDATLASTDVDTGVSPGVTGSRLLASGQVHVHSAGPVAQSGNRLVEALAVGITQRWIDHHFPAVERADPKAQAAVGLVELLEERARVKRKV